ncbi:MAG TPA: Rieske 2Fe-2S domain-containing protein [Candidatus Binataceae bacterium]|nr:Rieske 2Fe-2S domain-containing protein [Candidatus Binataceae bacterium]
MPPLPLNAFLDQVEASLENDLVPVGIFNDEEIFRAEIERIFTRNWVFVAHESEIPNKGDFVLRKIGLESVIISRDSDGKINVMSNHCRHRGTEVCQADRGNATHFNCPYHGWAYRNNGDWAGAPHLKEAYGGKLDTKQWGLLHAPHVDSHQGFIFASLDSDSPSLKEHLGNAAWMLDAIMGLHPAGMRVAGSPERYRVRANWKTAAENFTGDVYHVDHLHRSNEQVQTAAGLQGSCEFARSYEMGNGHNFVGHEWVKAIHPGFIFAGYPENYIEQFDLSGFDDAQLLMMRDKPPTVGTIFPNLSFIRVSAFTKLDEPHAVMTSFRQWQPLGPGELEVWNWQFVWNFMSEADVEAIYKIGQFNFGSAGVFEQDDTVSWESVAKVGASHWWRREAMQFNFQQGHKSAVDQSPDPHWTGPGIHRTTGYGEHRQLAFYRHWLKVMRENGKR